MQGTYTLKNVHYKMCWKEINGIYGIYKLLEIIPCKVFGYV